MGTIQMYDKFSFLQFLFLTLTVVGCALAEAPYPASGSKPDGVLLLLPPHYNQASNSKLSSQIVSSV